MGGRAAKASLPRRNGGDGDLYALVSYLFSLLLGHTERAVAPPHRPRCYSGGLGAAVCSSGGG